MSRRQNDRQSPKSSDALPLRTEKRIKRLPTGGEIEVTLHNRGILKSEISKATTNDAVFALFLELSESPSTKEDFETFRERIRSYLAKRNLPSDSPPRWVRTDAGHWCPYSREVAKNAVPKEYQHWTIRLEELTEPLSYERIAGQLLESLNHILDVKQLDPFLWRIEQFALRYNALMFAGRLNELAHVGSKTIAARKLGPHAKSKMADERKRVVRELTSAHWAENPIYRGDAFNTAQRILEKSNEKFLTLGLLPKGRKSMSAKTLAGYISKFDGG